MYTKLSKANEPGSIEMITAMNFHTQEIPEKINYNPKKLTEP